MSIFFVVILLLALFFSTTFLVYVCFFEEGPWPSLFRYAIVSGSLFLAVTGWVISAMCLPARVSEQFYLTPTTVNGPNGFSTQVVVYPNEYGGTSTVNLTSRYGKNLSASKRVRVTRFEKGGYYGIWFNMIGFMPEEMEIIDEKDEK